MKRFCFAALALLCVLFAGSAVPKARAASSVDLNAVARKVTQVAGVQENQIVLLTSDPTNYQFLEDLAIQVRSAGAFPLIWVTSDNYNERMFSEVPAKYDSQPPLLNSALYRMIDTQINVDYGGEQNFDFFARADQKRLAAQAKAFAPALHIFLGDHKRYVEVGNGIFPSPPNARLYRVSQSTLADTFWTAMNADYSKVQANADALKAAIAGARTMRVTNPNGTALTLGVSGVRFIVSAGHIAAGCMGINCYAGLPAGEVIFIPQPETASGKMVFDTTFWGKDLLKHFTVTFAAGKLVTMSSASDLTKLRLAYAAGGKGRDQFTQVDIGVNDQAQDIPGSLMRASFAGGSTSFGFGGDLGLGGSDASPFTFFATQHGSTVSVDGKTIIKDGKIVAGG